MRIPVEPELRRLDARREELDQMINSVRRRDGGAVEPAEQAVERTVQRLQQLASELFSLPKPAVREIIRHLFVKVIGDMETRDVVVSIALPSWATQPAGGDLAAMCLGRSRQSSTSSETHQDGMLLLADGTCQYVRSNWSSCYECRRQPRLAA